MNVIEFVSCLQRPYDGREGRKFKRIHLKLCLSSPFDQKSADWLLDNIDAHFPTAELHLKIASIKNLVKAPVRFRTNSGT